MKSNFFQPIRHLAGKRYWFLLAIVLYDRQPVASVIVWKRKRHIISVNTLMTTWKPLKYSTLLILILFLGNNIASCQGSSQQNGLEEDMADDGNLMASQLNRLQESLRWGRSPRTVSKPRFRPWGGKKSVETLPKSVYQQSTIDPLCLLPELRMELRSYPTCGWYVEKRNKFQPWGGKRSYRFLRALSESDYNALNTRNSYAAQPRKTAAEIGYNEIEIPFEINPDMVYAEPASTTFQKQQIYYPREGPRVERSAESPWREVKKKRPDKELPGNLMNDRKHEDTNLREDQPLNEKEGTGLITGLKNCEDKFSLEFSVDAKPRDKQPNMLRNSKLEKRFSKLKPGKKLLPDHSLRMRNSDRKKSTGHLKWRYR